MFVEYKYKYNYKYKYTNAITNTNRYMFVEYESHRAAALARKKLVQGSVFLFGQEIGQVLINEMNWKIMEFGHVQNEKWNTLPSNVDNDVPLLGGLGWTGAWGGRGNNVHSQGNF